MYETVYFAIALNKVDGKNCIMSVANRNKDEAHEILVKGIDHSGKTVILTLTIDSDFSNFDFIIREVLLKRSL